MNADNGPASPYRRLIALEVARRGGGEPRPLRKPAAPGFRPTPSSVGCTPYSKHGAPRHPTP